MEFLGSRLAESDFQVISSCPCGFDFRSSGFRSVFGDFFGQNEDLSSLRDADSYFMGSM